MRILAIRGENLASLAGAFELALEQPPLAQAGLFVITGPTGAGKSTLLDALCLALFDRIPRLPSGHGIAVGRADEEEAMRVKSNDVGSILRRGTGSGYAEVDFRGTDGKRYRSRWEVRRARGKATGRLQPQTLTLTDQASGQIIGDKKIETLNAISERLGLNFDQFRRSVLLAQGDFAAFLKANSSERSSLLERITGTDLYTRLSKSAYERATLESTRLKELEQRLQGVIPLADEARANLEQQKQALDKAQAAFNGELQQLQQQLDWYTQATALQADETRADDALKQALTDWELAAPRRELLRQVEQVQPLRGLFEAVQQATKELAEARQKQTRMTAEVETSTRTKQQAVEKLNASNQQLETAEQAGQQAQPNLTQCHRLDTRIETQTATLEAAQQAHNQAQGRHNEATAELTRHRQTLEQQQQQLQQASDWLTTHRAFATLAAEWGRWHAELQRTAGLIAGLKATEEKQRQATQLISSSQNTLTEQQAEHQQAEQQLTQLAATAKQLEQQVDGDSLEGLRSEREGLELQQGGVVTARELLRQTTTHQQQLTAAYQGLEMAQHAIEQHRQQTEEATAALAASNKILDEVQRARDSAALAQGEHAESLRALLETGEHCPVCGATEHPWATLERSFDQHLNELNQRVTALADEKEQLINRRATSQSEGQQAATEATHQQQQIETLQQQQGAVEQQWQALAFNGKPDGSLGDETISEAINQLGKRVEQQLNAVKSREQQAITLQNELAKSRRQLEQQQASERSAANRLMELERTLQQQQASQHQLQERQAEQQQQLDALLAQLAEPLAEIKQWAIELKANPEAFTNTCSDQVAAWQQQEQQRAQLEKTIQQTSQLQERASTSCNHTETEQQRTDAALSAAESNMAELQRERSTLFNGEPAAEVETRLNNQLTQARQERESAQQLLSSVSVTLATAEEGAVHWQQATVRRQTGLEGAEHKLEQALKRQQLTRAALEPLLEKAPGWLEAEQQGITTLKEARNRCQTVLTERQQRRSDHAANQPKADREALIATIDSTTAQQETTRQALVAAMTALKQDDEKRKTSGELQLQLQNQQQQWMLWASLNELIGSHDGKKFRTFAQSLTLDSLLGYANAHLTELARRYRLERVPGSDLELQVIDTDMGDEVRSVHSLSGGESFLVSLALALGLASLSSNTTQVESLFIDEGFGSLDQETLDIAIASLDTLQSLGRKVGVISHVPMLVERIGVRVAVEKLGGGKSQVTTIAV